MNSACFGRKRDECEKDLSAAHILSKSGYISVLTSATVADLAAMSGRHERKSVYVWVLAEGTTFRCVLPYVVPFSILRIDACRA